MLLKRTLMLFLRTLMLLECTLVLFNRTLSLSVGALTLFRDTLTLSPNVGVGHSEVTKAVQERPPSVLQEIPTLCVASLCCSNAPSCCFFCTLEG